MQLRVARLCLDCEELHVADVCPICASERYAFLTNWLPVEERRRFRRRPAPQPAAPAAAGGARTAISGVLRWLRGAPAPAPPHPLTRVSDHVPDLSFGDRRADPPKPSALRPEPAKHDGR
jgi:hypothetical protein